MMTAVLTHLSAAEFAARSAPETGEREELVEGEIVTMPAPGFEHGRVQFRIGFVLQMYLQTHRIGTIVTESGVVTRTEPDSVRGPDVSFYSFDSVPAGTMIVKYAEEPPDLCVEILSPSNTLAELVDKAHEYLAAGVNMVWIADPATRTLTVVADRIRTYQAHETLTTETVLPGFACVVSELFAA